MKSSGIWITKFLIFVFYLACVVSHATTPSSGIVHESPPSHEQNNGHKCCSSFCDGMFAETIGKNEDWFACHRGCRYFTLVQLLKGEKSKDAIRASCHKACTESYNASQSLDSSCQLGCDNQESMKIKGRRTNSDHSMSANLLSLPTFYSYMYKFFWTNSLVEHHESGNKSASNPFIVLKQSWSKFSATHPSHSIMSFLTERKSKQYEGAVEKEELFARGTSGTTTEKTTTVVEGIDPLAKLTPGQLFHKMMTTKVPEAPERNKTVDCIIRSSIWPQFYIHASSIQYQGIDIQELCNRPIPYGEYLILVTLVSLFFIILLVVIQLTCPLTPLNPDPEFDLSDMIGGKYDDDFEEEGSGAIFSFESTNSSLSDARDRYPPSYEEALKMLPIFQDVHKKFRSENQVV